MTDHNSEQERLKRIRDRQLADRDPGVKQRKYNQNYSVKSRRLAKKLTLKGMIADIPHVYKSAFTGLVLGLLVLWFLPQIWISRYAVPAAIFCIVLFTGLGAMIGNAQDVRDNIRDLS
jgi:MFS superfamily sulfate permease-like transporter